MEVFNTLGRRLETFVARSRVSMYVCGVTPYDTTHLGHARTYVFFDVVSRYLTSLGHEVSYVQNVTDVDDPLFRRASELGIPYTVLASTSLARYQQDMAALNVLPATHYPHASNEVPDMIRVIESLVAGGFAYRRGSRVYFSVGADPEYGKLSNLSIAEMKARNAEHGNDLTDPNKKHPLDFVLWRPAKPEEPSWPSPWGEGLPGWHIECSTMSTKYLGKQIDIHGGGDDLIYPHHENEIAQSEAFTGVKPFARYWLHVGMVKLNGTKMSKSLGNMIMASRLLEEYHPAAIRLYLLSYPYRQEFDYDERRLVAAQDKVKHLAHAMLKPTGHGALLDPAWARASFHQALENDFDTPLAIQSLSDLALEVIDAPSTSKLAPAQSELLRFCDLLGLAGLAEQHL